MRYFLTLLILVGLFGLVGCPPQYADNSITIQNNTYEYITGLYISPIYDNSWGINQLYYVVGPGESVIIYGLPDDHYDILVETDYDIYWVVYDVALYGGVDVRYNLYYKREAVKSINRLELPSLQSELYHHEKTDFLK